MGSTSDLPVMEKAAKFLEEMEIPFEMNDGWLNFTIPCINCHQAVEIKVAP